jgi:mannosyltransferase OCH1-like enzyme
VVPERTTAQVEEWWGRFASLHPEWDLRTHRDPLAPEEWPLTAPYWDRCHNGAELADLVRLEALIRDGGVYVDSDVEPYRPLDPLLPLQAFAAWEDYRSVPNAVLGATPNHPAIRACLQLAIERIDQPTWERGPGVMTAVLPGRTDVLLLPPGAFYPYHYSEAKTERGHDHRKEQPWAFVAHHWAGSWLPEEQRW